MGGGGGYPLCHGAGTEVVESFVSGGGGWGGGYPLCHGAGTEVVESFVGGGGNGGGATPCVMELALRWWSPL